MLLKWNLSLSVPCAALALGGSGDCCFHAHRAGSGPRSHRDEKAPPCSPHVRWAAFFWAAESVWESPPHCQKGEALVCVSISTTQKGVCSTQVAFISFTSWDYCKCWFEGGFLHLPSLPVSFQTGNQEYVPWLPFSSLISPRCVSSNSSVFTSTLQFLSVSIHACICLHSVAASYTLNSSAFTFFFLFVI